MADVQVLNTLDAKRGEIEAHIGSLEQDLEQARRDLSAILSAIKVEPLLVGDETQWQAVMSIPYIAEAKTLSLVSDFIGKEKP